MTPHRVRQIVSEALQRQKVDVGSDHAMLQRARLENALRLSAQRVAEGDIGAIAFYVKVLAELDRYQSAARANPVYDQAARERLLAQAEPRRGASRARSSPRRRPSATARPRPKRRRRRGTRRSTRVRPQALDKSRFAEEKSLDSASPGLGFPSGIWIFLPRALKILPWILARSRAAGARAGQALSLACGRSDASAIARGLLRTPNASRMLAAILG